MKTTDMFPVNGKKTKKAIPQRQLHKTIAITEAAALLLLIASIICMALWGKGALTNVLIFLVCAITFTIIVLLATHRIEKDDELSEINKFKAYFSTFWIFMALILAGAGALMFYIMIKDEHSLTVNLSIDGIVQFFLIILSLFNLCNSWYFLRFDTESERAADIVEDE